MDFGGRGLLRLSSLMVLLLQLVTIVKHAMRLLMKDAVLLLELMYGAVKLGVVHLELMDKVAKLVAISLEDVTLGDHLMKPILELLSVMSRF